MVITHDDQGGKQAVLPTKPGGPSNTLAMGKGKASVAEALMSLLMALIEATGDRLRFEIRSSKKVESCHGIGGGEGHILLSSMLMTATELFHLHAIFQGIENLFVALFLVSLVVAVLYYV